ncbi:MAG: winged helix DNA-binding domain-containing protein [Acidobacteriota bacterium]|nr:winged helix DNA-binding domain-containing protein [Acidobacteriota bacterium]
MDATTIRAWWWHRQGLDGSLMGEEPATVLARVGWARSVAGSNPYLTLFARAGTSRENADAAVAALAIHELPSARGCTYVLPASDFALGLRVGGNCGDEMPMARKFGVTDSEVEKLCSAMLRALEKGPLEPDELRAAVGGAARSLGAEVTKKGLTTTVPVALGKLQTAGEIRRVPINGRLDQQRYRYALWRPNPLTHFELSPMEAYTELARRFFDWIGPATVQEFQWFSGLGVKAAKSAIEPLKLAPPAPGDARLLTPADLDELRAFQPPKDPQYALVSGLDSMLLLRRDLLSLVDPEDRTQKVFVDRDVKELGGLKDLPSHAIMDRGRVIGLWEYDPAISQIVWTCFGKKNKALQQAVDRTEEFVRAQLGDARTFSLDSPKSRIPRIEALRKAAG